MFKSALFQEGFATAAASVQSLSVTAQAIARFLDQIEFALIESSFSTQQCGPGRTMN
jgi:hypothetical protein